jgi:hypothetical protein
MQKIPKQTIRATTIHRHKPQQMQFGRMEMKRHLSEQIGQMPQNPHVQKDHQHQNEVIDPPPTILETTIHQQETQRHLSEQIGPVHRSPYHHRKERRHQNEMIAPMQAIQNPTIHQLEPQQMQLGEREMGAHLLIHEHEPQQMQLDRKQMGQHLSEQIGQMLAPPIRI